MGTRIDRERIITEYHKELTEPGGALVRAIVGLVVLAAIVAAGISNYEEADLISRLEADTALLGVSQAGITASRDLYQSRRMARELKGF